MKKILLMVLIAALCIGCAGCASVRDANQILRAVASDDPYESDEQQLYYAAVDEFFAALDKGDAAAIRTMFSESVQREDADLDAQIERLMSVYPGPTDVNRKDVGSLAGDYSRIDGKNVSEVSSTFPVVSNGSYYWCHFDLTYVNEEDASQVGVTQVLFFTADERCICEYEENWKTPEEKGLVVYADSALDCEVRSIGGHPYKYTLADVPLDFSEVEAFLENSTSYSEFVQRFGEPNATNGNYVYELPDEDGQPRYLRLSVAKGKDEIEGASILDDFEWLRKVMD